MTMVELVDNDDIEVAEIQAGRKSDAWAYAVRVKSTPAVFVTRRDLRPHSCVVQRGGVPGAAPGPRDREDALRIEGTVAQEGAQPLIRVITCSVALVLVTESRGIVSAAHGAQVTPQHPSASILSPLLCFDSPG